MHERTDRATSRSVIKDYVELYGGTARLRVANKKKKQLQVSLKTLGYNPPLESTMASVLVSR